MSSRVNQKQSCRDEGLAPVNPLAKSMSRLRLRCTDVPLAWTFVAMALAGAILTTSGAGSAAADSTLVKRFSNGTTHNSVGIVDAREDAPQDGPQAIYPADDGSLYLLDQVNGPILRFDARGPATPVQSLELPEQMQPTDMVIRRCSVYVWDGAPRALLPTGREDAPVRGLTQPRPSEPPDNFTLSAFAHMGSHPPHPP